jgi:hypothetical protein
MWNCESIWALCLMGFLSQNYDSGIRDRIFRQLICKFSFDMFGALIHTNPGLCSFLVILPLPWRLPCLDFDLINAHSNLVVSLKIKKIVIWDHPSLGINFTGTIFHVLDWSKNHCIWPWKTLHSKFLKTGTVTLQFIWLIQIQAHIRVLYEVWSWEIPAPPH